MKVSISSLSFASTLKWVSSSKVISGLHWPLLVFNIFSSGDINHTHFHVFPSFIVTSQMPPAPHTSIALCEI